MVHTWWERVPNALSFLNAIVDSLADEKSLILQHTEPLPWGADFTAAVKLRVKQQNSSKAFETVSEPVEPGPYLLRKFCKPEKRAQYRPSKSLAAFLAESDDIVLHERYLWVEITSAEQLEAWSAFVSEYIKGRARGKAIASFVLEWQGAARVPRRKGITAFSFDECIGEYDRAVFSTLLSSSVPGSAFMKNYLAELAANVIGNDIELYGECFKRPRDFLQDPYRVIADCAAGAFRSDGRSFRISKSRGEVEHDIWLAQIRTIYPVLEEFREEFVQKHAADIAAQLPITSSYGEVYSNPNDVELGTLVFMSANGKLPLTAKEQKSLTDFRNARNKLSHLGVLTLEEIDALHR